MNKISPQGYIYGDDPKSDNPFWEEEKKDAVIEPLTVKSANQEQTIQATEGIDGYAPITVQPVKLVYKSGVNPSVDGVNLTPSAGNDGFSRVQINPIRSSLVPNLEPENVKSGVKILDTVGTYSGGSAGSSTKPFTVVMIYNESFIDRLYSDNECYIEGNHLQNYRIYSISDETENEPGKIYISENMIFESQPPEDIEIFVQMKINEGVITANKSGKITITLKISQLQGLDVYETKYYNINDELVDMTIILCKVDKGLVQMSEDAMIVFAGNT